MGVLGTGVVSNQSGASALATDNWWGCNSNPGPALVAGCDNIEATNGGSQTHAAWLVLGMSSNPATVAGGGMSTLTASFLKDSSASSIAASDLGALIGFADHLQRHGWHDLRSGFANSVDRHSFCHFQQQQHLRR